MPLRAAIIYNVFLDYEYKKPPNNNKYKIKKHKTKK